MTHDVSAQEEEEDEEEKAGRESLPNIALSFWDTAAGLHALPRPGSVWPPYHNICIIMHLLGSHTSGFFFFQPHLGRTTCPFWSCFAQSRHNHWRASGIALKQETWGGWPRCTTGGTSRCSGTGLLGHSNATGSLEYFFRPTSWIDSAWFTIKVCQRGDDVTFARTYRGEETVLHTLNYPRRSYIEDRTDSGAGIYFDASAWYRGNVGGFRNPRYTVFGSSESTPCAPAAITTCSTPWRGSNGDIALADWTQGNCGVIDQMSPRGLRAHAIGFKNGNALTVTALLDFRGTTTDIVTRWHCRGTCAGYRIGFKKTDQRIFTTYYSSTNEDTVLYTRIVVSPSGAVTAVEHVGGFPEASGSSLTRERSFQLSSLQMLQVAADWIIVGNGDTYGGHNDYVEVLAMSTDAREIRFTNVTEVFDFEDGEVPQVIAAMAREGGWTVRDGEGGNQVLCADMNHNIRTSLRQDYGALPFHALGADTAIFDA